MMQQNEEESFFPWILNRNGPERQLSSLFSNALAFSLAPIALSLADRLFHISDRSIRGSRVVVVVRNLGLNVIMVMVKRRRDESVHVKNARTDRQTNFCLFIAATQFATIRIDFETMHSFC